MMKDARILTVNLTDESCSTEMLPAELYRKYPGGSALGMYLMLERMAPGPGGPPRTTAAAVSSQLDSRPSMVSSACAMAV